MKVVTCLKAPDKDVYRTEEKALADLRRGKYGGCVKPPVRAYRCQRHWHLTSRQT